QMQLFKARQAAEKEVRDTLAQMGWTSADFTAKVERNPVLISGNYCSSHAGACTALDLLNDVALRERGWLARFSEQFKKFWDAGGRRKQQTLAAVAKAAENMQRQKQAPAMEMAVKIIEP